VPAISVGSVEVDIVPNTTGIYARLKAALEEAGAKAGKDAGEAAGKAFGPAMQSEIGSIGTTIGEQIGAQIANRIKDAVKDALKTGITLGGQQARPAAAKQGEQAGGAFARSLRAKLQEAFRSMPKLDVRLSDTGVDADLARLRARMESLSGKTVGIDIDAETARAQAADIEERLRRIGAAHPNVAVRADTARAIAQLQALQAQIDEITADPARIRIETDGQLGTRLRAAVQQAEASLPNVNIGADTSPAEVEIARLRAQLTSLRDARIGVDLDAGTALARITEIQARLARLSSQNANVAVRVDAGAAAAQLAAFQAAVNRLDGQTARVDVDTTSAVSGMQLLITAAIAFGPAIIPVLPVVAAGLGAIAAAGVAAAAGIGSIALVAVPAFKQIGGVLQAQKAAQDAATASTYQGGQASSQGASKALQLAGAQQSLATAQRNAARQISDAERGVSDAVRQSAQANAQAAAQVKQARVALSDAYAQAAERMLQATQQVDQAERDLAQAQKSSRQAQLDLTAARVEASRQLQDMNNQLTDSKLSETDAEIALTEATAARDRVLQNANATELDKKKALLQYDQAVQRLKEQRQETKRLTSDTAAANKAGVEGSATVKSAQERVAQAQQDVVDKTAALKTAQQDVTKTQIANTRAIADAQNKLSEAQKNVTETQRQGAENIARAQERVVQAQQSGADSIASAQRQIASASMSAAGGVDQAAIAQAKYQAELAKLSPSARDTFKAFLDLRSAFGDWSKSLQPTVMPIFTRALVSLRNTLPTLTPFVKGAADAIKNLQDRASKSVKSPFWQGFKKDLQGSVKPAIIGLGVAIGNLIKGMAGIVDGFLPHMDGISSRMQRITKRFADWGAGLKGSPAFEHFLTFASDKAALLGSALRKVGSAFLQVGEALSPISGPLLKVLGGVANFIAIVADKAPWMIQLIYGIIVATKLWTIAQWAFNAASDANPFVLLGIAILALIAIVIWAYNKFGWFRTGVQAVWSAVKTGAKAVTDWFAGPFSDFFTKKIPAMFRAALDWVKKNWPWILGALTGPIGLATVYIVKHWSQIRGGISDAWSSIKRNVLSPIGTFFTKTIPGWGTTLRDKMVGAFDSARAGIKTAWDKVKAIAKAPVQYVVDVVYNNGIRKVWNLVTDAFGGKHLAPLKFATGGIMPGYTPGKDVHLVPSVRGPVALSGGEAIMRPEWTRAVGPGYVGTMNAAARSGGVAGVRSQLGFKDGGIFSGIGDALGGAWDKVKAGANWLKDTFGNAVKSGVTHVVNPLIDAIPGGKIGFVGLLKDSLKNLALSLVGAGKEGDKRATPNIDYQASKGVGQWRPVVLKALAEVHQSRSLAGSTLRRMSQESGGNPTIVNRTDSNWKAGHPSVGLMQVIGPTFRSYAGKYRKTGPFLYGTSVNPMANIYSSMKYALGSYGSLSKAYDRKGGYDSGGYLQPGLNLAYNGTGRPEPVFTTSQANALTSMAARGPSGPMTFEGDLTLDSGEFLGRVRGEAVAVMREGQQQLISTLNAS
jgi:hypothetical protein